MKPDVLGGCQQLFGITESNRVDCGRAYGLVLGIYTNNASELEIAFFSRVANTFFANINL